MIVSEIWRTIIMCHDPCIMQSISLEWKSRVLQSEIRKNKEATKHSGLILARVHVLIGFCFCYNMFTP